MIKTVSQLHARLKLTLFLRTEGAGKGKKFPDTNCAIWAYNRKI
jgi:hypothetical protein